MNKLSRILTLVFCALALCILVRAEEPAVTSYAMDVTVARDGAMETTLRLTMTLPEGTSSLTLPLPVKPERVKTPGVSHSLQTDEAGVVWLTLTQKDGFGQAQSFTVTWKQDSAFTDSAARTLTLPLLSSHWGWDSPGFSFTIAMPAGFDATPVFESGYYGPLTDETLTWSAQTGLITGTVEGGLMAFDSFQVAVDLPEGYFSVPGAVYRYLTSLKGILQIVALLVLAGGIVYWFFRCQPGAMRIRSRPLPPDGATAGDLPFLLDGSSPSVAALLLEWAAAGYLSIYARNDRVILRRRMPMGNERKAYERQLFAALFDREHVCQLPDAAAYQAMAAASKQMRKTWRRRLYDQRRSLFRNARLLSALSTGLAGTVLLYAALPKAPLWTALAFVGLLPCFLGALCLQHWSGEPLRRPWASRVQAYIAMAAGVGLGIAGFIWGVWVLLPAAGWQIWLGRQTAFGEKRTSQGSEALRQLLCFRQYLLTVTQEQLRQELRQDPMYFYRLLPWAQALGLGGWFAARLGRLNLEDCDWFSTGRSQQTAQLFYDVLTPVLAVLRGRKNQTPAARRQNGGTQ